VPDFVADEGKTIPCDLLIARAAFGKGKGFFPHGRVVMVDDRGWTEEFFLAGMHHGTGTFVMER
jgi:hypothetical protein